MLRVFIGLLLASLTACQHQPNTDTAYRIDRVVVEPVPHRYGPIVRAQLKSKLQRVADDINSQLPGTTASRNLVVRVDSVDYDPPTAPLRLGRSEIEGEISARSPSVSQTFQFGGKDGRQAGLGEFLNLGGYYRASASFDRLTTELAYKFSRLYAAEHGTTPIRKDDLRQFSRQPATAPALPGKVPPPPLVVVGGI